MDVSDRKSFSSSSSSTHVIKPSSTSKPSASDENYQSNSENGANPPPPPPTTKHFMSPTISAASKAIAPRKKILAERNEISDTRIQNIGSKGTFSNPDINNSDDSLSVNVDSSPLPRPKFLRYKPNRGRDIILRHENEIKGEKERSATDEVIESEEVDEREEGVEEEEEEEEVEEEEEEREGFCRRVLKFLLVLVVLVFSTMYISSSNSPTYSQSTLQAMEGLRDGYLKIHDRVLNSMNFKEIVKLLEGGNEYLDGNNIGLMKINQTVIYKGVEEEEETVGEVYNGKVEEISEFEVEEEKGNGEEVYMGESVDILAGESEEVCDLETAKTGEAVDQMLELEGTESVEKLELLLQDNQIPTVTNVALQQEDEVAMEAVQEIDMGADEGLEMVESEMEKTENTTDKAGEVFMLEGMDNEITNFEILNLEGEDNLKEERLIEHIESEIILKAVIGFTLCFAVVASLVLAFRLMRKRNNKKKDYSSLVMKPLINESGVEEKRSSISPNEREEHDDKQRRVDDSFASPMSLINSTPLKDAEESSQTRAPSIELLGEFVVGELSSCSFRSRKIIESEVSSHSVPSDNKGLLQSKTTYSVPTHAQQLDFSEASSAVLPQSYGYFTPEKKVVSKKEEGGTGIDGEGKKVVVTTPLRRSSRLRSRVTSP